MKVWVPLPGIAQALGDLPGVEVGVYDGGAEFPPGVEDVEVWVPPFFGTPRTPEALARMARLRVVQTLTAGVDAYRPHMPDGVLLCNAKGVHDAGTAEWVVGAILAMQHDFPAFDEARREERWDYRFTGALADQTVLIVGYGSIGAAVERRLAGFEVEVVRVARTARDGVHGEDELPALLPDADVVVLLVPSTPATAGLADAAFLSRMKDGALLVNAARGPVVDTGALVAELNSRRIRAALDVTDPEPLPAGHPLWKAPGVLITPHVAGSTPASGRRALKLLRAQLERLLAGEPLVNVIEGAY
ncbi:2-hydroxyacid dehydrogenase [Bailinhaonella thermotolerans]|uniref:Phosphoglycerate dehydrogenase n=1 Tax=Bailinhaonella thermotolerans TaxID=1070861 RepID=A0A3A4AEP1_9ACTN|nr:2-hydroxyacid dehydrogenase [Bailinhaonella thermotolerans]RJL25214.1 phosphoglycerate dehydrogenase [Bailinhaonella thermotolerans]